jgi:hypothetical protein
MLINLEKLRLIPAYGKAVYAGNSYSIKFCNKATERVRQAVLELNKKYPELIVYFAKTGKVIYGGQFPSNSNFFSDWTRIVKPVI